MIKKTTEGIKVKKNFLIKLEVEAERRTKNQKVFKKHKQHLMRNWMLQVTEKNLE